MKIIAAILALCAAPALACTSPATGTLEDMMKQAIWTDTVGTIATTPYATVHVALPALDVPGFDCLTWDVELLLPPDFRMRYPTEASSAANLAASANKTFRVQMARRDHQSAVEIVRTWLRVKVRNPLASPGVYLANATGSSLWLYPVKFQVSGR